MINGNVCLPSAGCDRHFKSNSTISVRAGTDCIKFRAIPSLVLRTAFDCESLDRPRSASDFSLDLITLASSAFTITNGVA
jgi:hypothetical protein